MKCEGKIVEVKREESSVGGKPAVYTVAKILEVRDAWPKGMRMAGDLFLLGYEPEIIFKLGQKVTIEVEDVA
jgi:hypothetical protein